MLKFRQYSTDRLEATRGPGIFGLGIPVAAAGLLLYLLLFESYFSYKGLAYAVLFITLFFCVLLVGRVQIVLDNKTGEGWVHDRRLFSGRRWSFAVADVSRAEPRRGFLNLMNPEKTLISDMVRSDDHAVYDLTTGVFPALSLMNGHAVPLGPTMPNLWLWKGSLGQINDWLEITRDGSWCPGLAPEVHEPRQAKPPVD